MAAGPGLIEDKGLCSLFWATVVLSYLKELDTLTTKRADAAGTKPSKSLHEDCRWFPIDLLWRHPPAEQRRVHKRLWKFIVA